VGLWWFAWTSTPSIHWIVPIVAGVPFGVGVAQILQSLTAYLMDTYDIYFASAIAATVVLRSCCGAAFPLFSPTMFASLGDQWAMSVFAILSTVCMPIPFLFWKYGWWIRSKSHFAYKDATTSRSPRDSDLAISSPIDDDKVSQLDTQSDKEVTVREEAVTDHVRSGEAHPRCQRQPSGGGDAASSPETFESPNTSHTSTQPVSHQGSKLGAFQSVQLEV